MTRPPFFATALIMSSVMFRGMFDSARHEEWLENTGALLVSITSQKVLSETCAISTIMPSRFISSMTRLPRSFTPWLSFSPDEPTHARFLVCVRVM